MKMRSYIQFFAIIFASIALFACQTNSNAAQQSANEFWQAMSQEDFDSAARLMLKPSSTALRLGHALMAPESVEVGAVQIQETVAIAQTTIFSGQDQQTIVTIMQKVNDRWLIDYDAMKKSWTRSIINNVKSDLRQSVNWLDSQIDDAFNELDAVLTPVDELNF